MKIIITLLGICILSACTSMSQDAQIAIYPSVSTSDIGNNIPVFLTVDDVRTSAVLGSMGEGAQMTTSQDLAQTIGAALVNVYPVRPSWTN